MLIYKILRSGEWADIQAMGETAGAPIDVADGYVHFSTLEQVRETVTKHFEGVDGLYILAFETETLGESLRWEPSRGGALFPHLYAPLRLADVRWSRPLPLGLGGHMFPDDMT